MPIAPGDSAQKRSEYGQHEVAMMNQDGALWARHLSKRMLETARVRIGSRNANQTGG